MSLTLHYHPLSSFCWKALIALYENDTAFTPHLVDLGDPDARAALAGLWPMTKFPVLVDDARGATVPESTAIFDYLALYHPGPIALIPADPEAARQARLWDRIFDNHVHMPMQRIVAERLRPANAKDPTGVAQARASLATAYGVVEAQLAGRTWATGEAFTVADCAAAPALYFANKVAPLGAEHANVLAYLDRLKARPSFVRVLSEAEPYLHMFPEA